MEELEQITIKGYTELPLNQIDISETNVRKSRQRVGIEELKASIEKIGLIHPIIAIEYPEKPNSYKLIVGQRRYIAFSELGRQTIPAIIIDPVSSTTELIASFGENIHRKSLPYNDTIRVCEKLFEGTTGEKFERIEKIAKTLGISTSTVSKYLSYRLVPDEVRELVTKQKISAELAYRITSSFWPNTDKIINIARYMTKMTKSEWERALDIGKKNPNASIEDIVEEAKKPRTIYQLIVPLDIETRDLLSRIAKERGTDPIILVKNLIEDFVASELI